MSNEEEINPAYFDEAKQMFESLDDAQFINQVDPSVLDLADMIELFNYKARQFMQAFMFLEQYCREAAEACIAISTTIQEMEENHE